MPTQLHQLFRHLAWANDRVRDALRNSPGTEPRALSGFAHIIAAEHHWLARIRGEQPTMPVWPSLTLEECALHSAAHVAAFTRILDEASPNDLQGRIAYVNSAGRAFTSTLEDILLHVALHGTYHRGQVAIFMRDSGGTPAPTDYIAFARGAPAATRQDTPHG